MARLAKGSLIRLDGRTGASVADAVLFQYNPEALTRRLHSREDGPPAEMITCTLMFDATDALAAADETDPFSVHGVAPAMAALELLVHPEPAPPPSFWDRLLGRHPSGEIPTVLFEWGPLRAVPVRITRLDVTESLYDGELRPLRVSVHVTMAVVTDAGLPADHPASAAWRRYVQQLRATGDLGYADVPRPDGSG